jgi:hypothetical protein
MDVDGKVAMESLARVGLHRSMPHSCRSSPDFHTPIKKVRHVDPTSFLQVVLVASAYRRKLNHYQWRKMPHPVACQPKDGRIDRPPQISSTVKGQIRR